MVGIILKITGTITKMAPLSPDGSTSIIIGIIWAQMARCGTVAGRISIMIGIIWVPAERYRPAGIISMDIGTTWVPAAGCGMTAGSILIMIGII